MTFLRVAALRTLTVTLTLLAFALAVWWWRADAASRDAAVTRSLSVLGWLVVTLLLPWISIGIIRRVSRAERNDASAALVTTYTLASSVVWVWLGGIPGSATGWGLTAAATLFAGVYHLFACDWIAERFGR